MIQQITVFLENKSGRLSSLCAALGEAGIDMQALTIADTADYGVVRIICAEPERAAEVLRAADYRVNITRVTAIAVDNQPGGLAKLLAKLDEMNVNIEYGYCFSNAGETAVDVFKIRDAAKAAEATFKLEEAGFKVLRQEDL